MFYDALSLFHHSVRLQQDIADPTSVGGHQTSPSIEMIIGDWYLDEFGNPTREITARDHCSGHTPLRGE
jgi:hypothetical protein